ncbi:steroid receptor RNA activator 1-like [Topomyia yanbarensis]|uniref:steroid receptor RNA activator 1-like n=1 Tax=Topomyia yanbarensis TaxID=2498891 RepID=UPI00273BA074|nr:steroid receptor RNA activator 1-like [Topomyia yanbarensis]
MSGENYRSATKSHDPGWNDPPKLDYNTTGVSPGQSSKLSLNKRVAFPALSATDPAQPTGSLTGNLLPRFVPGDSKPPSAPVSPATQLLSLSTPPKSTPKQNLEIKLDQDVTIYPENAAMLKIFTDALEQLLLKLDSSKQVEIRKRCALIERDWNGGKLGDGLTKKLYRLAQALTDGKAIEANEIHRSIVVGHGSDCVQWAPALRQLVLAVPREETSSCDDDGKVEFVMNPISSA